MNIKWEGPKILYLGVLSKEETKSLPPEVWQSVMIADPRCQKVAAGPFYSVKGFAVDPVKEEKIKPPLPSLNAKPILSSKVRVRKDLEGYVVCFANGALNLVNQTGYDILALADGKNSISQILDFLSNKYGITPKAVESDVLQFVAENERMGSLQSRT